jgi:hypothetical protein
MLAGNLPVRGETDEQVREQGERGSWRGGDDGAVLAGRAAVPEAVRRPLARAETWRRRRSR